MRRNLKEELVFWLAVAVMAAMWALWFLMATSDAAADEPPTAKYLTDRSVRIVVEDDKTRSFGTGTVIRSRDGEAVIVTCEHLFRGMTVNTVATVEFFGGTDRRKHIAGVLFRDSKTDIAIINAAPAKELPSAQVADANYPFRVGEAASSIGCDHGSAPSVRRMRITAIDRYTGPPTIECTGEPAEGRSGGGLFNNAGDLIGVCSARDPHDRRGIYSSLKAVHAALALVKETPLPAVAQQRVCRPDGTCEDVQVGASMSFGVSRSSDPYANRQRKPAGQWDWIQFCQNRPYPHWHPPGPVANTPNTIPNTMDVAPLVQKLEELRGDIGKQRHVDLGPLTIKLDELIGKLDPSIGGATDSAAASGGLSSVLATIGTTGALAGLTGGTAGVAGIGLLVGRWLARRGLKRVQERRQHETSSAVTGAVTERIIERPHIVEKIVERESPQPATIHKFVNRPLPEMEGQAWAKAVETLAQQYPGRADEFRQLASLKEQIYHGMKVMERQQAQGA